MGRELRRIATGPERRRLRRACTLERLEPRCVLSGSAPWPAPVVLPTAEGHGSIMASGYVGAPASSVVEPTMKMENDSMGFSRSSPFVNGHNIHSLSPSDSISLPSNPYRTFGEVVSDLLGRDPWTGNYNQREAVTGSVNEQSDTFSIPTGGSISISIGGSISISISIGVSEKAPPSDHNDSPMASQLGGSSYPSNVPSLGGSTRGTHGLELDPSGTTVAGVAYVNAVSAETMPASAATAAETAHSHENRDLEHAPQVGRSSAIDSAAAGQFNSAIVTATGTTEPLGDSSLTASMVKVDQQPASNHALTGPHIASNATARVNNAQPFGRSLSAGEAAQLLAGKTALAELPLDLRRMEQALETVVSEVKLIGPEVARWLEGVHATPVTVAIAAAAVAGGSLYYWRRRGTRRVGRPEDEASSSWLFARLQPTPE